MKKATSKVGRQRRYCSHIQYCLLVLLVPMLVFLLGAGALTTQAHTNVSQFDPGQAVMTTQRTYAVGETFRIGHLQYRITSVKSSSEDMDSIRSPRHGNTFLIIGLTIENRSSANAEIRSSIGFNLQDKDGQKQEPSMGAILAVKNPIDGTIRPGETVSGEIGYEVGKGIHKFDLEVIPDPLSSNTHVANVRISLQ